MGNHAGRYGRTGGTAAFGLAAALLLGLGCGGKTAVDGAPSGSGGTGGRGGGLPTSCADIAAAYVAQVALARSCSPELSVEQCTLQIDTDLACPCPTYVNPANVDSVARLPELEEAWNEQACAAMAWECDAGICWLPYASGCMSPGPGSGEGVCSDLFAD